VVSHTNETITANYSEYAATAAKLEKRIYLLETVLQHTEVTPGKIKTLKLEQILTRVSEFIDSLLSQSKC
jgi:hypothetical protein